MIEDAKDAVETRRPPYKRRKWQLGMLMFVGSNVVGSTIQITTLPLPVLSTLQASGLVFNTAFATLLLKEPFTRLSLAGTVLTCAGAALIATFGAIGEPAHNLEQLLHLLKQPDFIVWMGGTLTVTVVTILIAHALKVWSSQKYLSQQLSKAQGPRTPSTSRRPSLTLHRSFTAQLPPQLRLRVHRLRVARGLAYALISGILSAHSLLVAKSAVELVIRTIVDHNNQFNRFQSWLILVALAFFALTQLYYLHLGLRLCSTSVLYPFVFCVYNVVAILDGLIYFQQGSRLSFLHAGLVALGTVILLSGVLALSWRLDDTIPSESAHQTLPPPRTPLTPGMGLVQSTGDDEREGLLPGGRARSSTSLSGPSIDEQTPLLVSRKRAPTTLSFQPSANANPRDIWAELDDESNDHDVLASLPRTPSPFLSRTRRRGDSASSQAVSSRSRRSSCSDQLGASQTPGGKESKDGDDEGDGGIPQPPSATGAPGGSSPPPTRTRSTSVHFVNNAQPPGQPSRWDLGVLNWLSGSGAGDGREDKNREHAPDK